MGDDFFEFTSEQVSKALASQKEEAERVKAIEENGLRKALKVSEPQEEER